MKGSGANHYPRAPARLFEQVTLQAIRASNIILLEPLPLVNILHNLHLWEILDGCCSDVSYVEASIPHGSILGPLLFLVYVNDLVTDLECDPHLFADDTSLLDIFTNPLTSSLKINRDLERIYKWGRLWRVEFNPIKIIFQIISNRKNVIYPNLIFDGVVINRSIEHVHLGLTITSNLSWQRHIDKAILKANKILYVMNNIKTKLPRNALCALYKSMYLPVIEYCDIIFDNCTIRAALALENPQRRAALACTGAYKHTSNDRLLLELNWIPLRQRRTNHELVMLYNRTIHGLAPSYLTAILPRPRDAVLITCHSLHPLHVSAVSKILF